MRLRVNACYRCLESGILFKVLAIDVTDYRRYRIEAIDRSGFHPEIFISGSQLMEPVEQTEEHFYDDAKLYAILVG